VRQHKGMGSRFGQETDMTAIIMISPPVYTSEHKRDNSLQTETPFWLGRQWIGLAHKNTRVSRYRSCIKRCWWHENNEI